MKKIIITIIMFLLSFSGVNAGGGFHFIGINGIQEHIYNNYVYNNIYDIEKYSKYKIKIDNFYKKILKKDKNTQKNIYITLNGKINKIINKYNLDYYEVSKSKKFKKLATLLGYIQLKSDKLIRDKILKNNDIHIEKLGLNYKKNILKNGEDISYKLCGKTDNNEIILEIDSQINFNKKDFKFEGLDIKENIGKNKFTLILSKGDNEIDILGHIFYFSYNKMKNHCFSVPKEIDEKSFEFINFTFAKDKNYVYQIKDSCEFSTEINGKILDLTILKGANPKTFKVGPGIFGIDDKKIYNKYVDIINQPDIKTFKLDNLIYKDKNNIYNHYREYSAQLCFRYIGKEKFYNVEGVDYKTYKKADEPGFYKDKNFYFLNGKKIDGTDSSKKLILLGGGSNVYFYNNGIIFEIFHMDKTIYRFFNKINIIKNSISEKNINNISIEGFACNYDRPEIKIFFTKKEYLKYKKDFEINCKNNN